MSMPATRVRVISEPPDFIHEDRWWRAYEADDEGFFVAWVGTWEASWRRVMDVADRHVRRGAERRCQHSTSDHSAAGPTWEDM